MRKEVRILRRQVEHDSHVMKLGKKRARPDAGKKDLISFTEEDIKWSTIPHNDA